MAEDESATTEVCEACLSSERSVSRRESLHGTYSMLMSDFTKEDGEVTSRPAAPSVCWECSAVLRRISEFKLRAHRARHTLLRRYSDHCFEWKTNSKPESMSQLVYYSTINFDYTFKYIGDVETDCYNEDGFIKKEKPDHLDEDNDLANPIDIASKVYDFTFPYMPEGIESKVFDNMRAESANSDDDTVAEPTEAIVEDKFAVPKLEKCEPALNSQGEWKTKKVRKDKSVRKLARLKKKKTDKARSEKEKSGVEVKKSEWRCRSCGQIFNTRGKMTYHQRTVHSDPVLCNECGRVFSFKPTLEKHMLTHFGGVPQYPCAVCGKSFAGRAGVKSHMIHVHAAGGERWRCEPCDLSFKTKYKYRTHLKWSKRHGGEGTERHECEKCHRKYKTKQRLFEHFSYQHLGKAAHKCHICGKEISSLLSLQKHLKYVHEGLEKPRRHVCETCGDAFKQVSMLRQHQYIHSGERPHACAECGARFRQKGSLYTHRRLVHLKLERGAPAAAAGAARV